MDMLGLALLRSATHFINTPILSIKPAHFYLVESSESSLFLSRPLDLYLFKVYLLLLLLITFSLSPACWPHIVVYQTSGWGNMFKRKFEMKKYVGKNWARMQETWFGSSSSWFYIVVWPGMNPVMCLNIIHKIITLE